DERAERFVSSDINCRRQIATRVLRNSSSSLALPASSFGHDTPAHVERRFVVLGVRDGDEWAAQRDRINCLNRDAVGTMPSSVIPKRSTSGDVEESEMFRTYASSRLLSTTIQTSAIAYLPTRAERRRGQRPQAVRNARSERQRRA